MANDVRIVSGQGTTLLVRLLYEGDEYGIKDSLVNDGPPLVEFFAVKQKSKLFLARYKASNFLDILGGVDLSPGTYGMILDGYDVLLVQRWLKKCLEQRPE